MTAARMLLAAALIGLAGCGGNNTYNPARVGPGTPTFLLAVSPASRTVTQGQSTTYTVTITGQAGFSTPVALSVTGLPENATASFEPAMVTPTAAGATATLTVVTGGLDGEVGSESRSRAPTPAGTHPLTVSAAGGGITRQQTVQLVVQSAGTPMFTLAAEPASQTIEAGESASYTVTLTSVNAFSSPVDLTVTGLPAGATASFAPQTATPTAGGATSTLTVVTGAGTPAGTSNLTITGAGGGQTQQASVSLTVTTPGNGDLGLTHPNEIAIHPNGQYAYVTNNLGLGFGAPGTVAQFRINPDGTLSPLTPALLPAGGSMSAIKVDPTGRFAYATSASDTLVFQYRVNADGTLSPLSPATINAATPGAHAGGTANDVVVHPNGQFAYVTVGGGSHISFFRINADGTLTNIGFITQFGIPTKMTIDPLGRFAYSTTQTGWNQYRIETDGTLSAIGAQFFTPLMFFLAIDPTGSHLYGTSRQVPAGTQAFQWTIQADGELAPLDPPSVPSGENTWGVAVSRTGEFVYVTDQTDFFGPGLVWQFRRNADGTLTPLSPPNVVTGASPAGITASPTADRVYVANVRGGTIGVYRINANGTLSPL